MDSNDRKNTVQKILVSVPDYIQKVKCDTTERTTPFKCAVLSCCNIFISYKERDKYPYKFHNFPNNEELCRTWKEKCGLPANADISKLKICSDHFSLDDYIRNYKEEFVNPNFKRKLKANAVPQNKILSNSNANVTIVLPEVLSPPALEPKISFDEIKKAVDENIYLLRKIEMIQKAKLQVEASIKIHKKKIVKKMREYDKIKGLLGNNWEKRMSAPKTEKCVLTQVFSDAQINLLQGKKAFWSHDDLAKAFTLRHMGGKECYLYLKNTLNLPLPALACVQKWAASYKPD